MLLHKLQLPRVLDTYLSSAVFCPCSGLSRTLCAEIVPLIAVGAARVNVILCRTLLGVDDLHCYRGDGVVPSLYCRVDQEWFGR